MIIATDMYRQGLDSAHHATPHHTSKPKDRGQHKQQGIPPASAIKPLLAPTTPMATASVEDCTV
jgi:hypothetical protein